MAWYRTRSGRLLYGKGGLAKVYEQRGYTLVDDEIAQAEVESGEAQTRADVEGELAAEVDARHDAEKADGDQEQVEDLDPGVLLVDHPYRHELTDLEQADVDAAIAEESTGGSVR